MKPDNSSRRIDYSDEVRLAHSKPVRAFFIILGTVSLIAGFIGIFLPVLPTVPFLLLSAFCYARSSVRFYNWLMNHKVFGPYLRDWRIHKAIPLKIKLLASVLLVLTLGSTILFIIPIFAVKIVLGLIGIAVLYYIWQFPTKK